MKEQILQTKIKKQLQQQGWLVVKLIKTTLNGIPDLICLKDGNTFFVEVKAESGVLSELQKMRIEELKNKGFETKIWTEYEKDFKRK